MTKTYTLNVTGDGVLTTAADGSILSIPFADGNSYYQAYLAWIAEGNTPNPYVPPPPAPEPTIEEKLASVGLSIDDLKTALGIK